MPKRIPLCCAAALLLAAAFPVRATLGEDVASVRADQAQMEAALQVSEGTAYSLHLLRLPSGTVVREYVSSSGMVFAIAWQGPVLPDLRQLLGRYFDEYAAMAAARDGTGATPRAQGSGLVVQSGGHMRAFSGRAYVQQWLPRGIALRDIQ